MAKAALTTKRALIDKANSTIVLVTGIAAFVFVFSLVSSKTLVSQATYQNRVIGAKRDARDRLKDDITAGKQLSDSFTTFNSSPQNVLGGSSTGTGAKDGDNAAIVLDALPSSYDFPALVTSLEKIIGNSGAKIGNISGTDDEVAQSTNTSSTSPTPVAMPFQLSVTGNYQKIQKLIDEFEHSIRPFNIQTLQISGDQKDLTLSLTAQTYYQPAKSLNIRREVVK
jgi:hypothetical protein